DPLVGAGIQKIEREGSAVEQLVVEGADVKLGAQFFLSACAKLADLELAEFITEGLRGPRDVAVGLGLDGGLINRAGLPHEVHDLLAGPSFRMDSGIDDQANSAKELRGEAAVIGDGILVEADLFAELLCVQGPAFDVCVEAEAVDAELRQVGQLL